MGEEFTSTLNFLSGETRVMPVEMRQLLEKLFFGISDSLVYPSYQMAKSMAKYEISGLSEIPINSKLSDFQALVDDALGENAPVGTTINKFVTDIANACQKVIKLLSITESIAGKEIYSMIKPFLNSVHNSFEKLKDSDLTIGKAAEAFISLYFFTGNGGPCVCFSKFAAIP